MSMKEYMEAGYKVVCGSMWGDVEIVDADMADCYEDDSVFESVDEAEKVAYFYDAQDYDD